jgi:hypothetical protein
VTDCASAASAPGGPGAALPRAEDDRRLILDLLGPVARRGGA